MRCADGAYGINGNERTEPSTSGTFRLIGGEGHDVEGNANAEPVMGPKIYVSTGSAEFVPELEVSVSSLQLTGTSASFDITSNTDWVVTPSESWITVSPAATVGVAKTAGSGYTCNSNKGECHVFSAKTLGGIKDMRGLHE